MRLRPSGRAGPLATQLDGFASYQENEAWTWEHLALTRARVVSASPAFAARIESGDPRRAHASARRAERWRAMWSRCAARSRRRRATSKRWDLKYAAGGLVDIEFIAQYLQLVHAAAAPEILDTSTARVLDKAWRLGLLATEDAEVLRPAVRLYHDLTQILRLCLPGPFDQATAAPGLGQPSGARGRRAGLRHARCFHRRDGGQGARELRAHPRRRAVIDAAPEFVCERRDRGANLDYFNSNSAISIFVVPILRIPRVTPGSCQ